MDGLSSIPETWLPRGTRRARIDTSYGSDNATITRDVDRIDVDCDFALSPSVHINAVDAKRVKIKVDMQWPLPDIKAEGPLHRDTNVAHLTDERSDRTADMWRTSDGRVIMSIHEPQHADINVVLTFQSAKE